MIDATVETFDDLIGEGRCWSTSGDRSVSRASR